DRCWHSNHQIRWRCSRSVPGQSLPGGLGRHHQAKPRTRPKNQRIFLQEVTTCQMSQSMARLSEWYGRLLDALVFAACILLLVMTVMIGADVVSRNIGGGGVAVSNELSEDILYLMTLLVAPWLLRQGQHIRVDIILRALPVRVAWALEWVGDIVGLLCCLY